MVDEPLLFATASESEANVIDSLIPWKVLVVDDDSSVHQVTNLVVDGIEFQSRPVQTHNAYSATEAIRLLQREPDFAVILLDVMMETDSAGLDLVDYIRHVANNERVRIVLRTGQPGNLPKGQVMADYAIDAYVEKTQVTADKLKSLLIDALSNYPQ